MTALSSSQVRSIGRVVFAAEGTAEDAEDLVDVWARALADRRGRKALLAHRAANPRCFCADGGDDAWTPGRCARCNGAIGGRR